MPGEDDMDGSNTVMRHPEDAPDMPDGKNGVALDRIPIDDGRMARLREAMDAEAAKGNEELPGLSETEMAKSEQDARADAGPQPTALQQGEMALDAQVHTMLLVMVCGMATTTALPPDVLWRSIMRCSGRLIGNMIAGDLGPVFKVREGIRKALIDTLKGMPVKPGPAPAKVPPLPPNLLRQ